MILVDTSGVAAFNSALTLELARLEREISAKFAGWTRKVFTGLVRGTPQWSGDLTANWNYSIGSPNLTYRMTAMKAEGGQFWSALDVKQVGDEQAVSMALEEMSKVTPPTWRDVVYFANNTPIAPAVEAQTVLIRPVNLIDGRVAMIQYTIDNQGRYQP